MKIKLINYIKKIFKLQNSQTLMEFKNVSKFLISIFLKGYYDTILFMLFGVYFPKNSELIIK